MYMALPVNNILVFVPWLQACLVCVLRNCDTFQSFRKKKIMIITSTAWEPQGPRMTHQISPGLDNLENVWSFVKVVDQPLIVKQYYVSKSGNKFLCRYWKFNGCFPVQCFGLKANNCYYCLCISSEFWLPWNFACKEIICNTVAGFILFQLCKQRFRSAPAVSCIFWEDI